MGLKVGVSAGPKTAKPSVEREGFSQWGERRWSAEGVVGQYDEEPEDADLCEIQPGEARGALV